MDKQTGVGSVIELACRHVLVDAIKVMLPHGGSKLAGVKDILKNLYNGFQRTLMDFFRNI